MTLRQHLMISSFEPRFSLNKNEQKAEKFISRVHFDLERLTWTFKGQIRNSTLGQGHIITQESHAAYQSIRRGEIKTTTRYGFQTVCKCVFRIFLVNCYLIAFQPNFGITSFDNLPIFLLIWSVQKISKPKALAIDS